MSVVLHRSSIATERRFFAGMAVLVLAIVIAGFADTYYLWPLTRATHTATGRLLPSPTPVVVHVHALLFSGWIVLLVAQAGLAASGRIALHTRLGKTAFWFVPLMVITGVMTAVHGARSGWNPGGPFPDALAFMVSGMRDIGNFAVLTSAGLWYRQRPAVHTRLMVLGTIGGLLWPAITRIPVLAGRVGPMMLVLATLALAPAVHDIVTRARTRWLSLALGLGILATFPAAVAVGTSAWWRTFATVLTR